jgi:uncharacterized membrane protein (UPF0127 family)
MQGRSRTSRLSGLPTVEVGGVEVRVAIGLRARLLGLSGLEPGPAGAGLLIPRCSSVHTFGMRFPLDVHFLDRGRAVIATRHRVGPRRLVSHRGADAVLELPALADELDLL